MPYFFFGQFEGVSLLILCVDADVYHFCAEGFDLLTGFGIRVKSIYASTQATGRCDSLQTRHAGTEDHHAGRCNCSRCRGQHREQTG